MKQATVTIKDSEYNIKQSFRALMEFEKLTGKNAFEANTSVTDTLTMYYSLLLASNDAFVMSLNDFLACLDEDANILPQFHNYMKSLIEPEKAVATKKKVETR